MDLFRSEYGLLGAVGFISCQGDGDTVSHKMYSCDKDIILKMVGIPAETCRQEYCE